jgi:hypothetical protein
MTGLIYYYTSRALISAAFGALFAFVGTPWWGALVVGVVAFALFFWAPHSGRYVVQRDRGIKALRRDEFTQAIADKAARNAFVVTMLVLGGITIYFGTFVHSDVPIAMLGVVLGFGGATYFATDVRLRRFRGSS